MSRATACPGGHPRGPTGTFLATLHIGSAVKQSEAGLSARRQRGDIELSALGVGESSPTPDQPPRLWAALAGGSIRSICSYLRNRADRDRIGQAPSHVHPRPTIPAAHWSEDPQSRLEHQQDFQS